MGNSKLTLRVVGATENPRPEVWASILVDMLQASQEISDGWDEIVYEITDEGTVRRLSSWIAASNG